MDSAFCRGMGMYLLRNYCVAFKPLLGTENFGIIFSPIFEIWAMIFGCGRFLGNGFGKRFHRCQGTLAPLPRTGKG
jgi:hypothetical protein